MNSVSYCPDGKRILTSGEDEQAIVWNVLSGQPDGRLKGHEGSVLNGKFSPNGKWIVTIGSDKTARVWDAQSYSERFRLEAAIRTVQAMAISPDSKYLATAGWDGVVRIWNLETGELNREFKEHTEGVIGVVFSRAGDRLLSFSRDKTACIWTMASDDKVIFDRHKGFVHFGVFTADSRQVLTTSVDETTRLWEADSGKEVKVFDSVGARIPLAFLSPDNTRLAIQNADFSLDLFHFPEGQKLAHIPCQHAFPSLVFSPDSTRLCLPSDLRGSIRIFNTKAGGELAYLSAPIDSEIHDIAISPGGDQIAAVGENGFVTIWKKRRPEPIWGIVYLPGFWFLFIFGLALLWQLWRWLHRLKTQGNLQSTSDLLGLEQ